MMENKGSGRLLSLSHSGYCGSGSSCNCTGCVDFYSNPQLILQEPIKPTSPVRWFTLDQIIPGSPTCGYNASRMMGDGSAPICNPDNQNAHCCSPGGYCGNAPEFCFCLGCIDFTKNPALVFPPKTWIDSGPDMDKWGGQVPQVNGKMATCNPLSDKYYCCSNQGSCGSGAEYCSCPGCVNYQITINSRI